MSNARRSLDRRSMLRLLGGAGALAASGGSLAACSGDGGGNGGGGSGRVIVATVSEVSPELDSDAFHEEWFATFTEQTGIEVELRTYPFDQYANSLQLLFSQNDPPDVFRSAGTQLSFPVPFVRGWVRSLEEFVTDEFRARYPEGALDPQISGLHVGEELYAVPFVSAGAVYPLYTNLELLERYGGVSEPPQTWSEFAEVAERITVDSGGDVAGFYPLEGYVFRGLQATAGADIELGPTGLSFATGFSEAAAPEQIEMMELLQRLATAGAMVAGWESESGQERTQLWNAFVQDQVAMAIGTNWYYREMTRMREDLPLALTSVPVPDSGRGGYHGQEYVFLPFWHMGANAQDPEAAWQVLEFLSSPEVTMAWYSQAKRNPPPLPLSEYE
jgi:multiple sugar transport system substrate-binding protein